MAGKSTVLRCTAAAALLGTVGLLAPAASVHLPYLDAIMLRTFSSDNPLEGSSSFAVEMQEMKRVHSPCRYPTSPGAPTWPFLIRSYTGDCVCWCWACLVVQRAEIADSCTARGGGGRGGAGRYVMVDATEDTLVLVDELGKGTEVPPSPLSPTLPRTALQSSWGTPGGFRTLPGALFLGGEGHHRGGGAGGCRDQPGSSLPGVAGRHPLQGAPEAARQRHVCSFSLWGASDSSGRGSLACLGMLSTSERHLSEAHITAPPALVEQAGGGGAVVRQGIFATHLHKLLELPLSTQHQVRMRMETREFGGGRYVEPTLRLVPGQCTNSLALTVARAAGIPQGLLDRAEYMHQVASAPPPPHLPPLDPTMAPPGQSAWALDLIRLWPPICPCLL